MDVQKQRQRRKKKSKPNTNRSPEGQNTEYWPSIHQGAVLEANTNIQTTRNKDVPQAFQHPKIIACAPQGQKTTPEMWGGVQDFLLGLWETYIGKKRSKLGCRMREHNDIYGIYGNTP